MSARVHVSFLLFSISCPLLNHLAVLHLKMNRNMQIWNESDFKREVNCNLFAIVNFESPYSDLNYGRGHINKCILTFVKTNVCILSSPFIVICILIHISNVINPYH